jgi:hypothetical protein
MKRRFILICLLSILIVLGQIVIARLVPIVGSIFYIPSIIFLSILEESAGLKALSGSPDGWPIPTILGWQIVAVFWWSFWVMLLTLIYIIKGYRAKSYVQI